MKKIQAMLAAGAMIFMLSSCGQAENAGEAQTDTINNIPQSGENAGETQTDIINNISKEADEADSDGEKDAAYDISDGMEDAAYDVLDFLAGEYSYTLNDKTGRLVIQKISDGYDISDYESESSYRFLANSSNIQSIENNKIYIKYPEQVFSDDTVDFSYYILEYDTEGINVYYGETAFEDAQLLYRAAKQSGRDTAAELYVNVLRDYLSAGKTDFTVSFIDLDDDSIREMVVFFGEAQADGGYLFTIKNGEAVPVLQEDSDCFGQYGGFTYKEKGNVFVTEMETVTDTQISSRIFYYTMENGKALCKDATQSIMQFDSGESRFYVNDTEVERGKFDSIAEKYGLSEMTTVSYSDGVRVTDEQMDMIYNAYHN